MILQTLVAIVASVLGLLSSLSMLVMLMAGLANAKEGQIQQGKWMMLGIAVLAAGSLGAAIWLIVKHKPWHAAAAGILPMPVVVALFVVLLLIEW
ncbi:MAG: hypothetical protein ACT4PL_03665 [Phycisphaerales bacterium]